jgi:hypothetical protein
VNSPNEIASMEARKNSIFQKVGRNVVNLQILEWKLKKLQVFQLDGPLKDVPRTVHDRDQRLSRKMLGPITHEMVESLFPASHPQSEFENLTTEIWVSHSMRISGGAEAKEEIRSQLHRLVEDRNQLIHHMFGGFDPRSAESCLNLEARLDAQRARINQVFAWVEELAAGVLEQIEKLKNEDLAQFKLESD